MENERNKLDTLFLHMTDGVVAFDREGHLIHCNPAACELLGRTADECVYSELFESICPFSHVITMQRSDYVEGELTVGERSVELYFAPFSDEESGGVLIVLHDVTEHRKTEERRKELVKQIRNEAETARISLRNARRDAVEAFKKAQKEGMPEDESKDGEAQAQKLLEKFTKTLDEALQKKEKEIMTV